MRFAVLIIFSIFLTACKSSPYWGNFERISLSTVPDKIDVGERVSGSSCAVMWYEASIANAARSAISKVQNANALKSVEIDASFFCIYVSGIPVNDPVAQPNKNK